MQGEFFMFKKKRGCPAPPQPKVLGRLIRSAELPLEVIEGLPAIELRGNREAVPRRKQREPRQKSGM